MAIDKNAVVKEAQKFIAKGQFDKAIAEWKKLLRESPDDPNIYNTIGDLCLKKDARLDAVSAYKRAADLLAADGFTSKAIALYKKILNIDHQQFEVHLALADLNAEKGLTGPALESYKLIADYYIHEHDMVKALGIYQKMADMNPSNHAFRIKLGDMYAKEGMKAEAAKTYLDAADAYVSKNAFPDARLLFEKVLALDPNNKAVYHKAGLVYFKEGKFVEACKTLKPAFENDPSNQELAELYLEALSKAGKQDEAEEALIMLITADPYRVDLRETLFHLYLAKKEYEKAFDQVSTLAQIKIEQSEGEAAESLLKTFVSESPRFIPGRQKLAEFYASNSRDNDAAAELLQAAELLAEEDPEKAKTLLNRALAFAPGMPEAKKLLERLEASTIAPSAAAPAAAVHEKMPASAPPPAAPAVEEDSSDVNEAFTEADVLIKYGLPAKAMEQLEGLASQHPDNARVRSKLRDLYHEQGNTEKAVHHALLLADTYAKEGRADMAEAALQTACEIAPNDPSVLSRIGSAPPAAPPAEAQPPEITLEQFEAPSPLPETAPLTFEEAAPPEEGKIDFETIGTELPPFEEISPFEAPPAVEAPDTEQPPAPEALEEGAAEADLDEIWAEAEFYYQQGLFDEARKHYAKIIAITPSDRRAIDRLTEISHEEDETREFTKLAEAVESLENEDVLPEVGESALATSASDEEAVNRLMREISEVNKEQKPVPPQRLAPVPAEEIIPSVTEPAKGPAPAKEDFFDLGEELQKEVSAAAQERKKKSEDFFDLAAELKKDELSGASVAAPLPVALESQTLDDIFEEFKKGVEQQAIKEDADTHYNLGVAYKEMGLLDDAITEFIMTPENEPRFVQSRYMLGLCYLEKGEYQNAIGEIQNAIDYVDTIGPGDDSQNRLGMQYDLGLAYQGAGNIKAALSEFQKIADVNPEYRDIAAKLKDLRKGDYVSLAQLKDDIEKEITSKFFEEGERIEREEKNKRNEKIRN